MDNKHVTLTLKFVIKLSLLEVGESRLLHHYCETRAQVGLLYVCGSNALSHTHKEREQNPTFQYVLNLLAVLGPSRTVPQTSTSLITRRCLHLQRMTEKLSKASWLTLAAAEQRPWQIAKRCMLGS